MAGPAWWRGGERARFARPLRLVPLAPLYVLFDLDPATSVARRAGRLRVGHPWNRPEALDRLQCFYRDPVSALRPLSSELATALALSTRTAVSGRDDPLAVLGHLASLSSPAGEAR